MCGLVTFMVDTAAALAKNIIQVPQVQGTADIFRGFMVSLYVKGKENSYYVCNREPTEVLIDTLWSLDFFAFRDAMNLSASLREPSHLSMR